MRGQGDEGSDGVETPSNEDGRAQGGREAGHREGARRGDDGGRREGAGMGARRGMDDGGDDAKVLIIRGMEQGWLGIMMGRE